MHEIVARAAESDVDGQAAVESWCHAFSTRGESCLWSPTAPCSLDGTGAFMGAVMEVMEQRYS